MAPVAHDVTNVLVGLARPYTAPTGTAMVPDSLATGELWPSPWVYSGATTEGLTLGGDRDINDIRIEEQSTPAQRLVTSSTITIGFTASEDTLATMRLAIGGGTITTQAAAAGVIGKETLRLSDDLELLAAGFEGRSKQGFWRRVYIPRVSSTASLEVTYRRAESQRSYEVTLSALCPMNEITIVNMTALAL